jgi:hypothetical protein
VKKADTVSVLVFDAGGVLLGIDGDLVRAVGPEGELGIVPHAGLLFGRAKADSLRRRRVYLEYATRKRSVVVDAVLGLHAFPREVLTPLPFALRAFGAPSWVLGTMWHLERLVWLVDLFATEALSDEVEAA